MEAAKEKPVNKKATTKATAKNPSTMKVKVSPKAKSRAQPMTSKKNAPASKSSKETHSTEGSCSEDDEPMVLSPASAKRMRKRAEYAARKKRSSQEDGSCSGTGTEAFDAPPGPLAWALSLVARVETLTKEVFELREARILMSCLTRDSTSASMLRIHLSTVIAFSMP